MYKKKIFLLIIILIVLFVFMQTNKNRPSSIIKSLKLHNRLQSLDKVLLFRVNYFGFFDLGEAELINKGSTSYQGRQVYHLEAKARILQFISRFYNAQAQVASFVDKDKLHSLKFTQTLIFPDKPKDEREVLYDQKNNIMELDGVKREILADTQDPLSAILYIRHQALDIEKEFDININTNQKNYRLYVKVLRKDEYTIDNKSMGVWVLNGSISRRDKSHRNKSTVIFWLLDTPNKLPILIKAVTKVGSITARLVDIK